MADGMFRTSGAAYDSYMGRYSSGLARLLIAFADVAAGDRVLDVGCGTGMLTAELVATTGADRVAAVDPSDSYAEACRARAPGVDVRVGTAEDLPFADATFDATVSQLVVNFLADPDAGVGAMRRVTRPEGTVAACVWDYAGEMTLLRAFWDAAVALDPDAGILDEARMPNCDPDSLRRLWESVGLAEVRTAALHPSATYTDFDDLWMSFTAGVGPAGAYVVGLDEDRRQDLRDEVRRRLGDPQGGFELTARAWAVTGRRR